MAANIEWVIEELEGPDTDPETLEIVNVDHADTYSEALNRAAGLEHYRIGLVRDAQSGRSWAYVVNDRLPDAFLDAYGEVTVATPARYRAEVVPAVTTAVRMKDRHPTPWRVRSATRGDGFEVYDDAGAIVKDGFPVRRDAVGWALVNVAA